MSRTKKRAPKGSTHSCRSRKKGGCAWCQGNRTHAAKKALAKAKAGEVK